MRGVADRQGRHAELVRPAGTAHQHQPAHHAVVGDHGVGEPDGLVEHARLRVLEFVGERRNTGRVRRTGRRIGHERQAHAGVGTARRRERELHGLGTGSRHVERGASECGRQQREARSHRAARTPAGARGVTIPADGGLAGHVAGPPQRYTR